MQLRDRKLTQAGTHAETLRRMQGQSKTLTLTSKHRTLSQAFLRLADRRLRRCRCTGALCKQRQLLRRCDLDQMKQRFRRHRATTRALLQAPVQLNHVQLHHQHSESRTEKPRWRRRQHRRCCEARPQMRKVASASMQLSPDRRAHSQRASSAIAQANHCLTKQNCQHESRQRRQQSDRKRQR